MLIKCKNSHFEPPFADFGVTHRVHLWLDGKRIVDFLLAIIELFSLALAAAALISEICRNRRFLKGWVTLSANFTYMWTSPIAFCTTRSGLAFLQTVRLFDLQQAQTLTFSRLSTNIPAENCRHCGVYKQAIREMIQMLLPVAFWCSTKEHFPHYFVSARHALFVCAL